MAQFIDVLLRGVMLVLVSVTVGGVAWVFFVLRAAPHVKPDGATSLALRTVALAAALGAAAQVAVSLLVLGDLARHATSLPLGAYLETGFARAALVRVEFGIVLAVLARRLATRPVGRSAWAALLVGALALVISS